MRHTLPQLIHNLFEQMLLNISEACSYYITYRIDYTPHEFDKQRLCPWTILSETILGVHCTIGEDIYTKSGELYIHPKVQCCRDDGMRSVLRRKVYTSHLVFVLVLGSMLVLCCVSLRSNERCRTKRRCSWVGQTTLLLLTSQSSR